jgi:hypothetical protein
MEQGIGGLKMEKANETFWYVLVQQKKNTIICLGLLHYWLMLYIGVAMISQLKLLANIVMIQ